MSETSCTDQPVAEPTDWELSVDQAMRRYAAMVFRVCLGILRDAHEAEDATQATFLALHQQYKQHTAIHHVGGWLQQVARRTSLDIVRHRKRRKSRERIHNTVSPQGHEGSDQTACEACAEETRAVVAEELDKLPAKYRSVLILHYFGGMSQDEIAQQMRCRSGALRVRLYRAKKMLGERLCGRGIDAAPAVVAVMMERMIHRAVTDAIISKAQTASAALGRASSALRIFPKSGASGLVRAGVWGAKAKVAVTAAALVTATTAVTVCVPQPAKLAARSVVQTVVMPVRNVMAEVLEPSRHEEVAEIQQPVVARPAGQQISSFQIHWNDPPSPVADRMIATTSMFAMNEPIHTYTPRTFAFGGGGGGEWPAIHPGGRAAGASQTRVVRNDLNRPWKLKIGVGEFSPESLEIGGRIVGLLGTAVTGGAVNDPPLGELYQKITLPGEQIILQGNSDQAQQSQEIDDGPLSMGKPITYETIAANLQMAAEAAAAAHPVAINFSWGATADVVTADGFATSGINPFLLEVPTYYQSAASDFMSLGVASVDEAGSAGSSVFVTEVGSSMAASPTQALPVSEPVSLPEPGCLLLAAGGLLLLRRHRKINSL